MFMVLTHSALHVRENGRMKEVGTARDHVRDKGFRFLHVVLDLVGCGIGYEAAELCGNVFGDLMSSVP